MKLKAEYLHTFIAIDNGSGYVWYDVTEYTLYDTISITTRGMSEQFMSAQSEASFDLIYNETIHNLLRSTTEDVLVRINSDQYPSLGFRSLGSFALGSSQVRFTGRTSPAFGRAYNGILANTRLAVRATDSLDLLDVPCGDIAFIYNPTPINDYEGPFTFANPGNITYSILHRLAERAGMAGRVSGVNIPITHTAVAPNSEDTSILALLDTLFHEHGYVIGMDQFDNITAIPWILDAPLFTTHTFTESDVRDNFNESISPRQYLGVELAWYRMDTKTNQLLFRDRDLPYNDDGSFQGLIIPKETYYPFATNVIDETTGQPQKVYQEYQDDGILYHTNKAIVNNLDINRHAVNSDFTSIVATKNRYIEYRTANVALDVDVNLTGNKKAQVRFYNSSTTNDYDLFYLRILGDIIYKREKSLFKSFEGTLERKLFKYESQFIETEANAERYVRRRASQVLKNRTQYNISSDIFVGVGSLVCVQLDDGTDTCALILERTLDVGSDAYSYIAIQYDETPLDLSVKNVYSPPTPADTFAPTRQARYVGAYSMLPLMENGDWLLVTEDIIIPD